MVTRIAPDGTLRRRQIDTAQRSDGQQMEDLATRALTAPIRYQPAAGAIVYHVSVDDRVIMAAEQDLPEALESLISAAMVTGQDV
jgi:hypothetical protein